MGGMDVTDLDPAEVFSVSHALAHPPAAVFAALDHLTGVPGRMERVEAPGRPLVVVDYAHTPDALDKALAGLRPLAAARGGALWCVFGCGGGADCSCCSRVCN